MMMALAMPSAAATVMGLRVLGRMWRRIMRTGGAPIERAASTNSRSLRASTSPRTTRAVCIQEVLPIDTTIKIKMPASGPRRLDRTSRNSITITSKRGSRGRARNRSVMRIRTPSRRRKKPAVTPISVPRQMAMDMAVKPTAIDTLPPAIMRANRSRPSSSVPKGNIKLGALLRINRLA